MLTEALARLKADRHLAIATVVLSLVAYTNNKFANHEAEPSSAEATH